MEQLLAILHSSDPKRSLQWLADQLGLSKHTVKKWKLIPAKHCREIERILGGRITAEQMRPDIFGQKQDAA